MAKAAQYLLLLSLLLFPLTGLLAQDDSADSGSGVDEEESGDYAEPEAPALPWEGESPYWVNGQEFSAVASAPFIGTSECLYCHTDKKVGFLKTAHARSLNDDNMPLERQGCESCHGAGGAHAVLKSKGAIFAFDWKDPEKTSHICLRCHSWLSSAEQWQRLAHAKAGLKCTTCHDPHVDPASKQRFLLRGDPDAMCAGCHTDVAHDIARFSHHPVVIDPANDPGARAMHCTSCHDVHAGKGRRMLAERRIVDLCLKCHIDKGGPFSFVHMANEDAIGGGCMDCHMQHGSDNPWLLVGEGRALCEQCHTSFEDHYQPLTCWTTGCHVSMHGSNKSPLFLE